MTLTPGREGHAASLGGKAVSRCRTRKTEKVQPGLLLPALPPCPGEAPLKRSGPAAPSHPLPRCCAFSKGGQDEVKRGTFVSRRPRGVYGSAPPQPRRPFCRTPSVLAVIALPHGFFFALSATRVQDGGRGSGGRREVGGGMASLAAVRLTRGCSTLSSSLSSSSTATPR